MTIKIDTDVPLPDAYRSRTRFPWKDMEAGQSFFAPGYKTAGMAGPGKQMNLSHPRLSVPGSKWTVRTVTENGVSGVRVWRVA